MIRAHYLKRENVVRLVPRRFGTRIRSDQPDLFMVIEKSYLIAIRHQWRRVA